MRAQINLSERIHHPAHRRMLPVLHLEPMLRPAALIWPVATLRHESLQPHAAGGARQVRPDLALLERRDKDAVRPARQQAGEIGLSPHQTLDVVHSQLVLHQEAEDHRDRMGDPAAVSVAV